MRERERTMGCLLHEPSKFYNNVFLFFGLTTLETLVNFDWLIYCIECPNVSTTSFNLHHWGYTSVYWPLSDPFRSLVINKPTEKRIK